MFSCVFMKTLAWGPLMLRGNTGLTLYVLYAVFVKQVVRYLMQPTLYFQVGCRAPWAG